MTPDIHDAPLTPLATWRSARRRATRWLALLALALLTLSWATACRQPAGKEQPADAVFYTRVLTMESSRPRARGVAIRNGLVVEVASPRRLKALVGPSTKIYNWGRWTIVPGLIDAHVDLLALGESMVGLDLEDSTGLEDISGRVRAVLAERGVGKERWIVGYGWEEHRFRDFLPVDRTLLDKVAPTRPVLLHRADRRAALVNARALELARLDARSPDPAGGRLVRRKDGSLSGLLLGSAVDLVADLVPPHPRDVHRALIDAALRRLVEAGYTTVHDMGGDSRTWQVLLEMAKESRLPLRVYATIDATDPMLPRFLEAGPQIDLYNHYLTLRTVRIDLDGELGARTARLVSPYADSPEERGLEFHEAKELMALARRCYDQNFQLAIHASGDAATRTALDTLEQIMPSWRHWQRVRPRLDGADLVAPDDASRFGMTHLIASVQPARLGRQLHWLVDRLGEERLAWAHPWRSLAQGGAVVVFGSGAPELPADPRRTLVTAINREDETGWPAGGWKPMQRLTAPETLRAMTLGPAYAGFEEKLKGSIRPGKLADFTVLSRDPLYTEPYELNRVRVLGTIVGGRFRHRTRYLR